MAKGDQQNPELGAASAERDPDSDGSPAESRVSGSDDAADGMSFPGSAATSEVTDPEPKPSARLPPRDIPDVESLLFLSDPHAEQLLDDGEPSIVLDSAAFVLQRLDPLEQEGAYEDEAGRRYLPGVVSLTPISLGAFFLNCGALVAAMVFAFLYAPNYLIALSVFHTVIFGNLWTYYVAYRTQRRWLQFRQVLFILVLIAFLQWMFVDLLGHPPQAAVAKARIGSGYETFIWVEIVINAIIAGLVTSHWAVLGRGYRKVDEDADLRWWQRARSARRHASTESSKGG